ncbi:protein FAM110C-like [Paramormyrops kingsleyae]|uniref:protein FAM110C-like n=1 Tax=Paramormyrops kingsleyae TaxID=1676925 RepID=UPI000CD63094|nr:protein FAM110C-like [Paramormyrops kingsleyae]
MPSSIRTPSTTVGLSTRILEKGPGYLRKQLELEGDVKNQRSAVEMLAESKSRYVKCHQVIKSDPMDHTDSYTGGTDGISNGIHKRCFNNYAARVNMENHHIHAENDGSYRKKEGIVRRSSSKRQRPDSLLIYRQKSELVKGPANGNPTESLIKRLFLSSTKDKMGDQPETPVNLLNEKIHTKCTETTMHHQRILEHKSPTFISEVRKADGDTDVHRKGVFRSYSDVSSRYSKHVADFETFFRFCGLGADVVESLGMENFSARSGEISARIRSISQSTLNDEFTRENCKSNGLLQEDLDKSVPQGLSVVERNARIIKWLYSCSNARQSGRVLRDLD